MRGGPVTHTHAHTHTRGGPCHTRTHTHTYTHFAEPIMQTDTDVHNILSSTALYTYTHARIHTYALTLDVSKMDAAQISKISRVHVDIRTAIWAVWGYMGLLFYMGYMHADSPGCEAVLSLLPTHVCLSLTLSLSLSLLRLLFSIFICKYYCSSTSDASRLLQLCTATTTATPLLPLPPLELKQW